MCYLTWPVWIHVDRCHLFNCTNFPDHNLRSDSNIRQRSQRTVIGWRQTTASDRWSQVWAIYRTYISYIADHCRSMSMRTCMVSAQSHRRHLSMDSDCPGQVQLVSTIFDVGFIRPEMLFQGGFRWGKRVFLTFLFCLMCAKSILTIYHRGGSILAAAYRT